MKKKTKIFIIPIVLLYLFGFIYLFFNGNPITKAESKKIVAQYLEETHPEYSFTVDYVGYYPGEGTYIVHFISKDGTVQGNIDVIDGKIRSEGLHFPSE